MTYDYDVLIVGGGLTGLTAAIALPKELRIGIIDAVTHHQSIGGRSIALSYGSQQLLARWGIWDALSDVATSVQKVHVSDRGHFGMTRFSASQAGVPALGYVVPMQALQSVLQTAVERNSTLEFICPASVSAMEPYEQGWLLDLGHRHLTASLVIAADGTNSTIRKLQNISVTENYYHQIAMVANVHLAGSHNNTAYERFTSNGAIALLPLVEQSCALIWTVPEADYRLQDDETFLRELQKQFGYRLGRFIGVSERHTHILKQSYASEQVRQGLVLLGNAAHTLHPIAAQGFNLGLRDIACLAETIGHADFLQRYVQLRLNDQKRVMRFTDGLTKVFSEGWLTYPRNLGLSLLDMTPPIKRMLLNQFAGI